MKPTADLPELDERLHEWSRFFKDRHHFSRCASMEGRFNPHAPGSWDSGWGDPGAPSAILPEIKLGRVLETHKCVMGLGSDSWGLSRKWAITYAYCYPHLERWMVLKFIKRHTGRRFTWVQYLDLLEIARLRVWTDLTIQAVSASLH